MSNPSVGEMGTGGGSRLFYFGTQIEVRLGDRVRLKRWFRSDLEGIVCYLPGISPRNPYMENEYTIQWGIKATDGAVWIMVYCPERAQPKKNLKFVARSEEKGMSSETVLD